MTKHFLIDVESERVPITRSQDKLYMTDKELHASMVELYPNVYSLLLNDRSYLIHVESGKEPSLTINGKTISPKIISNRSELIQRYGGHTESIETATELRAPMQGVITKVMVQSGDTVTKGQGVMVLEAMKMENELRAPCSGQILQIRVQKAESVVPGALLIEFE